MNNGRLAFFNLVKEMRAAQKEYFSTRTHSALVRSKDLQRRYDELKAVHAADMKSYLQKDDQVKKLQDGIDKLINEKKRIG